jgi:hypothetical protein
MNRDALPAPKHWLLRQPVRMREPPSALCTLHVTTCGAETTGALSGRAADIRVSSPGHRRIRATTRTLAEREGDEPANDREGTFPAQQRLRRSGQDSRGAACRNRTDDLLITSETLYRLS